jgi:hypothetical protein
MGKVISLDERRGGQALNQVEKGKPAGTDPGASVKLLLPEGDLERMVGRHLKARQLAGNKDPVADPSSPLGAMVAAGMNKLEALRLINKSGLDAREALAESNTPK